LLARTLRESCRRWLQEVLLVAERRLPATFARARYTIWVRRSRLRNTARRQPDEPRYSAQDLVRDRTRLCHELIRPLLDTLSHGPYRPFMAG
jgi:hypothetical protein